VSGGETSAPGGGGGGPSAGNDPLQRLDPDRAARDDRSDRLDPDRAARAATSASSRTGAPAIDTRPYRWAIGALGVAVAIVISVLLFLSGRSGTVGVAPGHRLHNFAAPLATSKLVGNANLAKPCRLGYLRSESVNTCLLSRRAPLVLAFFVTDSSACVREVDTLQQVSRRLGRTPVQFAAVAVRASKNATARLVRDHHWTLPVAYDLDGALGSVYSVEICPLLELADRGGVVKYRLIGDRWLDAAALAAKVRALAG
jgi:hypothetical protein